VPAVSRLCVLSLRCSAYLLGDAAALELTDKAGTIQRKHVGHAQQRQRRQRRQQRQQQQRQRQQRQRQQRQRQQRQRLLTKAPSYCTGRAGSGGWPAAGKGTAAAAWASTAAAMNPQRPAAGGCHSGQSLGGHVPAWCLAVDFVVPSEPAW
jgi:sRNA-binding protein